MQCASTIDIILSGIIRYCHEKLHTWLQISSDFRYRTLAALDVLAVCARTFYCARFSVEEMLFFSPQPCDDKLFTYFADNLIIIAGVAIGIGVVMVSTAWVHCDCSRDGGCVVLMCSKPRGCTLMCCLQTPGGAL